MDESLWKHDDVFGQLHRPMIEDLKTDQLKPIVESMAGGPVVSFNWEIDRAQEGKKGFYGYKLIPTFNWTCVDGSTGSRRCCLKQVKPIESVHYMYLEPFSVPLCRLFGFVPLDDGEEIVVLDYLNPIGHESLDQAGKEWFLGVKAALNATPISDDYLSDLNHLASQKEQQQPSKLSQEDFMRRLFSLADEGRLIPELTSLLAGRQIADSERLEALRLETLSRARKLRSVLTNIELDVGIHPETGERKCFDVHSTCLEPQFKDLRQALGKPQGVNDGWGEGWSDPESWATIYATAYNQASSDHLTPDDVLAGARDHWLLHALEPDWKNWFVDRGLAGEEGAAQNIVSIMQWLFDHIDGLHDN